METIGIIVLLVWYIFCNVAVPCILSTEEMKEDLWEDQNIIGKILANSFYLPAWILKGIMSARKN